MDLAKILEIIKLSPERLFPISLVGAFLLFASPQWLELLGLASLVDQYRAYVGGVFLVTTALVLAAWSSAGYQWLSPRLKESLWIQAGRPNFMI